jgi:hypothetical protein
MIKIIVNSSVLSLEMALHHISKYHLQHKFDVVDYNDYSIRLATNTKGKTMESTYGGHNTGWVLHILQLVQAVRGFGMDNVNCPLKPIQLDWLEKFTGDPKDKVVAALGMLGRSHLHPLYLFENFNFEQVCEAYALHAEDRAVSMMDWLEMMPKKVRA